MEKKDRVTAIGGGTGNFTILSGLKNHNLDLASIVTMADDGGSSGDLRDQYGALPPGDIRQCLVALSRSDEIWRKLFNLRFNKGTLAGQNFGNLFITALHQVTGDFEKALELAGKILQTQGLVIPVTLDDVRLIAETTNGQEIIGEHNIDLKQEPIRSIRYNIQPSANPNAVARLLQSHMNVIVPGDMWTSTVPNFEIEDIADAYRDSSAIKVYLCNLMTQKNHTHGFRVIDFVKVFERYLGNDIFDYVIYNNVMPDQEFLKAYAQEGEYPVEFRLEDFHGRKTQFIGENLISQKIPKVVEGDHLTRALIRHNPLKVASILVNLLKKRE